jgi:2-polyprenyl-3-methyl-5-hydroxy-6-metoxy-1,4-benzoquinol methylase
MHHRCGDLADEQMDRFLSGRELYGNDLTLDELQRWYAEEEEGYADLGAKERGSYAYEYHALNWRHAFRHIPNQKALRILGLGSAYGDELQPLAGHAASITILDPSSAFIHRELAGIPLTYIKPQVSGQISLIDQSIDLVTSFGVLHHIANVGFVLTELHRVLAPGGYLVLREPIVSMGDWRQSRKGLTKNERGIPLEILRQLTAAAGFSILKETLCDFPMTRALLGKIKPQVFNDPMATAIDAMLSRLFAWNVRYHATTTWQKLRPASCAMVLQKSSSVQDVDASDSSIIANSSQL